MKRSNLALMGGVALIAAIVSLVISNKIFGSPSQEHITVPVVVKISSDFPEPQTDPSYQSFYNSAANNPTQVIQIGNGQNSQPFNQPSQ